LTLQKFKEKMDFQKVAQLKSEIKKKPQDFEKLFELASTFIVSGEIKSALECLKKIRKIIPKDASLLNLLGSLYAQIGETEKVEDCFKQAVSFNPSFNEAIFNLALLYYYRNQFDKAVELFLRVIEINPQDAEAYNDLGVIYFQQGKNQKAKETFKKALKFKSDYKEALYNLIEIYLKEKDWENAQTVLSKLISLEPENKKLQTLSNQLKKECANKKSVPFEKKLNIGFVSTWFDHSQAYVTKALQEVLAKEHNTFIFARQGDVFGEAKLETKGFWEVPNLFTYPHYQIPAEVLANWIEKNELDAVIFNEEYDWNLVVTAKEKGAKVFTYLDYCKDDWKENMGWYDGVLCSTKRTFDLIKNLCPSYYIGWGIDTAVFTPQNIKEKYTFFHNAGWLGINYRKMTPAVILAFEAVSRIKPEYTLLLHSQVELEKFPPEIAKIVKQNRNITFEQKTVSPPGLYHSGKIYVYPSKLEGLGLTVLEALSCGLPVIATDTAPMNEFVKDGFNGFLVKVAKRITCLDEISFKEEIVNLNDLAEKMFLLGSDENLFIKLSQNARQDVLKNYQWQDKIKKLCQIVEEVVAR
jgi:1,2-diacylglycerol 3-alpha-glucosyltransferase